MFVSKLNVSFGGKHDNFENWLQFDLNLHTTEHVIGVASVSYTLDIGNKDGTSSLEAMQKDWDANSMKPGGEQRGYVCDPVRTNDSANDLHVAVGGLGQTKKENMLG